MLFLILSVGSNPGVVKERLSALTAAGYCVVPAYSKEEAIEKLFEGDFDLVLICPSLGRDAGRLANIVRRHRPSIPIVSISAEEGPIADFGTHIAGGSLDALVAAVPKTLAKQPSTLPSKVNASKVFAAKA